MTYHARKLRTNTVSACTDPIGGASPRGSSRRLPRWRSRSALLLILAAVAPSSTAIADGRIVVVNDEWPLSNNGFASAPTTAQFALNVAAWFTGGGAGSFLVRSSNFGLTGSTLAATMTGAGHSWVVNAAASDTVAALLAYDAVFLTTQSAPDLSNLTQYVRSGGSVYLAAGTAADASAWDLFLHNFGLDLGSLNGLSGNHAIAGSHPLIAGVTALYHLNGNDVVDLDPNSKSNQVIAVAGTHGLIGVYDGGGCATGRIVVMNDEWPLSNTGFSNAGSTKQLALNVANWFTGGVPGNFLVRSTNFGLTGSSLAATMTAAGHSWTVDATAPDALLSDLLPYDAIYLCSTPTNQATLTAYVKAGGCVYLAGGVGEIPGWDLFLGAFGLGMVGLNGISGNIAVSNPHPLFAGVTSFYQLSGNDIVDLSPSSLANELQVVIGTHGLCGIYDGCKADVWVDLGCAQGGALGDPNLVGTGSLEPGSTGSINLTNAASNSPALLLISTGPVTAVPFLCTTLKVVPIALHLSLNTDPSGAIPLSFTWPATPAGTTLYVQYVILDPTSPCGVTASNAICGAAP